MGVVESVVGGLASGLVGGIFGSSASDKAADAQRDAANQAAATQMAMLERSIQVQKPWLKAGKTALNALMGTEKNPGLLTAGPGEFTKSPGYEFRLKSGEDAVKNYLSSSGLSTAGGGLKALTDYNQNFASNEYQNFLNQYYQSLNPYLSMAGAGQVSAGNVSNATQSTGANVANTQIAAGDARASGYINQANAITGGINSGLNNALALYTAFK